MERDISVVGVPTGRASHLFYGGNQTSYAPNLLGYHQKRNQAVNEDFVPGDIIFFDLNSDGRPDQAGICESWDGANIITIDGYISDGSEVAWHSVMRCSRHGTHIFGAYRPDYREELK